MKIFLKNTGLPGILLLMFTILANAVFAESVQNTKENISATDFSERLNYINSSFQNGELASRLWYWGFLGLYTVGTAAQLTLFFEANKIAYTPDPKLTLTQQQDHFRQDMMAGTITTALGAVFMAISPMPSMYARNTLASMPEDTLEMRVAKLKKAEDLFYESSQWEIDNTSLWMHAANFGVNLAAGLVIWLAFSRTIIDGLIDFLPGFAVGEIMIFTQPTQSISDRNKYERRYNSKVSYDPRKQEENRLHVAAAPGGLMAVYEF